jgi:ribose 5-phosphate isomerase B
MKIAVTTDHAGFEVLKQLKTFLTEQGHECVDFGPKAFDAADDYPDFMFPAAKAVAAGECEAGVILGGSGQGEAMAANRIKGARCTVFYSPAMPKGAINAEGDEPKDEYEILRLSREHNMANMLALGARFLTIDEMQKAVMVWLGEPQGNIDRHKRRVAKLDQF